MRKATVFAMVTVLAIVLCGCGSEDNEATVNVTGIWDAQWNHNAAVYVLTQSGNTVTGFHKDESGERGEITGSVSGNTIALHVAPLDDEFHEGSMTGTVSGNTITGTGTDHVTGGTGTFTATKR